MSSSKGGFQPDSDVHILYEDQQKINKFARLNAKLKDIRAEVTDCENDLKSLEEAADEICLLDDDEKIPYLFGEVFIYQNIEMAQKSLDEAKEAVEKQMSELNQQSNEVKEIITDLKGHLYGKFGNRINLEADD